MWYTGTMKFYCHTQSVDRNGNFGPDPRCPGWITVECPTKSYTDAASLLPLDAQKHIQECMDAYNSDEQNYPIHELGALIGQTCGWALGFSFMDQLNWDNLLENT